jgi:hypothetical protein
MEQMSQMEETADPEPKRCRKSAQMHRLQQEREFMMTASQLAKRLFRLSKLRDPNENHTSPT